MNKLKLISVTVLCALALSACVDDKESASVTALREAKTSYLKAQADYQTAQAEVAKINAEVAKAKAEAEVAIARLQAEAEAAKTEAETKEIQLRAEAAQKEFEAKLAAIEAQAKAEAAHYAATYQEYLNQLAAAERQAVMDQQNDLVMVIGDYKQTLGAIREAENTISNKTLEIADLNRQKLEALAGNALASAKNAVLSKQAEISGYKIQLQQYQIWYEADAAAKKVLVEKLREGLPGKADAVKAAKDKYLAVDEQIAALEEQNTALYKVMNGYYGLDDQYNNIHFAGNLDTLGNAWKVLNDAELSIHSRRIYYSNIGGEGYYSLNNIKNIKYYSWEVDKLLADMDKELVQIKAELTEADTLTAATKTLEVLFAELEKAQKANEDANKAWNAASEVVDKAQIDVNKANDALNEAQLSGDQAKITAAAAALDKAQEALTKAQDALNKASEVVNGKLVSGVWVPGTESNFQQIKSDYENKRNANKSLESQINNLKTIIESAEERIEEVKAAKEICFGDLLERVVAVYEEYDANHESISELRTERADLYALYRIADNEYTADKDIVNSWDLAVEYDDDNEDYLGVVEGRINKLEGKIATAEAELQNLNDILADPEKIDQKYCTLLNDQIKQVEKDLAAAQAELETEKVKAAAYKATIDAWSMGEAE